MYANSVKTYVICSTEKCIESFYEKDWECKACNIKRVLKRQYNNKDEILQRGRDKYARFKFLDNRLKALEEKLSIFKSTFWILNSKVMHKMSKNVIQFLILWTTKWLQKQLMFL